MTMGLRRERGGATATTRIPESFPATANDTATSLARSGCHMEVGAKLSFSQRLDAEQLARAVRLSLDAEPILGCSFEPGWYSARWRRIPHLDAMPAFSLVETEDPRSAALAFRAIPVTDDGPQVAVRLVRGPERDDLCVNVSHLPADGQGTKRYLHVLAAIYTNLADNPAYEPEPDLTPRPCGADVWAHLTDAQKHAAAEAGRPVMPNWEVPHLSTSGGGRTQLDLALAPERFSAVKEFGGERDATVNDMLLTAFFRALTTSFPPDPGTRMSFTSTADHRRFLGVDPETLPVTNISISGFLGLDYLPGESFEGTLGRVSECMRAWKATGYGVVGQKQAASFARLGFTTMKALYAAMGRMGGGKSLPLFTNMGVIEAEKLRFDGVEPVSAYMLGPAAFGGSLVPTISTYRDTLTVSIGYCADDLQGEVVRKVLDDMDAELRF